MLPKLLFMSPQINATYKNLVLDSGSFLNHKLGRTLALISNPPTFVYHNTKTNVCPGYLPYQSTSHHRKKTKPHCRTSSYVCGYFLGSFLTLRFEIEY
jgi:hypothetical protein